MIFGKKIRELRDEQGVLQRQLAALLEIDTPMFSKIERGDRRAKREHVIKLAKYLHQDEKDDVFPTCRLSPTWSVAWSRVNIQT